MPSSPHRRRRSSPPPLASKSSAPPKLPPLAPVGQQPNIATSTNNSIPPSPIAPAFSPITPRAVPALPAISVPPQPPPPAPENGTHTHTPTPTAIPASNTDDVSHEHQQHPPHPQQPEQRTAIAPTEFMPPPPPKPFTSEDSTDAIALRAAISSLQIQKKKAQDDLRTLEKAKQQAVQEPERFRDELAAGRVQERKMTGGDLRAILDAESDDEEDEDKDEKMTDADAAHEKRPFPQIPGPQNIVRMPHVNWEKYHLVGEPLDRMHEQQRRWPGSKAYGSGEREREFAVAAPYSPWLDPLEAKAPGEEGERKDSAGSGMNGGGSEHPMETRRGGVRR